MKNNFQKIGQASSVGLTIVFSTVIGLFIGLGLDKLFNTQPYLFIIFLILGIISGFWTVLKETLKK